MVKKSIFSFCLLAVSIFNNSIIICLETKSKRMGLLLKAKIKRKVLNHHERNRKLDRLNPHNKYKCNNLSMDSLSDFSFIWSFFNIFFRFFCSLFTCLLACLLYYAPIIYLFKYILTTISCYELFSFFKFCSKKRPWDT